MTTANDDKWQPLVGPAFESLSLAATCIYGLTQWKKDRPVRQLQVAVPMALSAAHSIGTLRALSEPNHFRGLAAMTRSNIELCVNTCFILVSEPEVAERMESYAMQFHARHTRFTVGSTEIKHSQHDAILAEPRISAALAAFTAKKGRPLTSWTDKALSDRISQVQARVGKRIASALQRGVEIAYSDSSELIHGTYAGVQAEFGESPFKRAPKIEGLRQNGLFGKVCLYLYVNTEALGAVGATLAYFKNDKDSIDYILAIAGVLARQMIEATEE